jgi:hypothetical protein
MVKTSPIFQETWMLIILFRKSSPLAPILSQMIPVNILTLHFLRSI